MSTPTQPAVTQPYEEEAERLVADDQEDTIAETRPLPEPETADVRRSRPELMPSIGHIGRYALKYVIGEGGLGTVYAAHDPLLSRLIAIKTLHVDLPAADRAQFNDMVLNEARAAGSLNHPHIVTMYDAGPSEQGTYIAMELLRGKDLRQLLAGGWQPTAAQAALIVRRVADALHYAHHKGVVHRDIKPANIFMVGRTQPRVLDFGIARIRQAESLAQRDDPESRFQEIAGGSPYYMAPEQVAHKPVDRRVDVYALGVVLYELLVFKRPFSGGCLEDIADEVLNKPVPAPHALNPKVPKALSEIAMRAMCRDPDQRTRSARRLAAELREWLDAAEGAERSPRMSSASLAAGGGVRQAMAGPGVRMWSLAVAALAVVALGAGWYVWHARAGHARAPEAARGVAAEGRGVARSLPDTRVRPKVAIAASTVAALASSASVPSLLVKPAVGAVSNMASGVTDANAEAVLSAPSAAVVAAVAASQSASVQATSPSSNQGPGLAVTTGTLKLAVTPWGEVWVDGRQLGVTPPMRQLSLPPGKHVVTVRNGDLPAYSQTVDVQAGKSAHIKHQF